MKKSIFLLSFTLSLILNPLPFLHAQWPTLPDTNFWPITPDTGLIIGYGEFPQIVSDENGGAIVVFRTDSPWIIKAKRVDKWGALQWNGGSGVVVGGTGDWQVFDDFFSGDIAEDGSGGVFVGFSDIHCNGCPIPWEGDISYATVQKIDHEGNKLWGEGIRATTLDSVYQTAVQVESDGAGGCIVSWLDDSNITSPPSNYYNVYVQKIDYAGNLCWGDSALRISGGPTMPVRPGWVVDENGATFLLWWDGSTYRIQKLSNTGLKLWGEGGIAITQIPWNIGISNRRGGIIVAGLISNSGRYNLACQNIDSLGQKLWGSTGIILADSVDINESGATGLMFVNNEQIVISYYYAQTGNSNVHLQKLTLDGTKLLGNDGVLPSNYPSSKGGGGIVFFDDSLLYAWNDQRGGTYVQKLDLFGDKIWSEDKHFSSKGINKFTHDGYGGIIKVNKLLDFSIRLSKISRNGIIGEVIDPIVALDISDNSLHEKLILYQNSPNPFNPSTSISYYLPKTTQVNLTIYNILGQQVKVLVNEVKHSGYHTVQWNGTDYETKAASSGIYIYQLKTGQTTLQRKFILVR